MARSWIIRGGRGLKSALETVAAELGLDFESTERRPDVPMHAIDLPRLAVLHTWNDTESAGWVRMLFDQSKIDYELINDDDIKKGRLNRRFDVAHVSIGNSFPPSFERILFDGNEILKRSIG